jgi:uncharacterized protein (TIGR02246 family)
MTNERRPLLSSVNAYTPHRTTEDARAELRAILRKLSVAWQNRRYEELADLFDDKIVMVLPAFSGRIEGREAVVDGYREFMETAAVSDYQEDLPTIDVWGDTAIASYHWEMTWISGAKVESAAGYDAFVFARSSDGDGSWRAVWRTMSLDVPHQRSAVEH